MNLTTREREQVARMLARAFADDPLARFVFPDERDRHLRLVALYRLYLDFFSTHGTVMVTADRCAAALWLPPGRYPLRTVDQIRLLPHIARTTGLAMPRAMRVIDHLDHMYPAGRKCWYLGVLGVDPQRQRQGIGGALLKDGLRVCDEDRMPAYLETAEPSNLPFYAAHAFREFASSPLPGATQVWSLWRDPPP